MLITAAGLVDLNVARGDNRRVNGAIPDLQVAARDTNEEQVASSAPIVIIYRTPDKGNRDLRQRVASDTGHDAIAMEVNDVNGDLRGSGRAAHAVVNDDMLALEMNARIVVDHVPVATIRSLGTAAGIHDAAVAEVRLLFLADGAAAGHPAKPARRRCAEIPAEHEFEGRVGTRIHGQKVLASTTNKDGVLRQRCEVHAERVMVGARHRYYCEAAAIGGGTERPLTVGTGGSHLNASRAVAAGAEHGNRNDVRACCQRGQRCRKQAGCYKF